MTDLVYILLIFVGLAVVFLFFNMMFGKLLRPDRPEAEKSRIYECGEPTIGSAFIQFDVRYYVVALLFVIFDVEVAFFFPWAVVFGSANELARNPSAERGQEIMRQLDPHLPGPDGKVAATPETIKPETAKSWAWIAFADILVFFGVLMVGFAYVWRRGDIDWVRSMASERIAEAKPEELSKRSAGESVVVAGQN